MADKFYIAAQSAGFISFQTPIVDASTYSPTDYKLTITEGLVNIGGNGRGYYIDAETFDITTLVSDTNYVLYVSAPTGSQTAGKAIIEQPMSVSDYTSDVSEQTAIWEGDDSGRRAIATFRVRDDSDDSIDPTSIRTVTNFDYKNLLQIMEEYGLFAFNDGNFIYRGQNIIPDVALNASVQNMDIVYKDTTDYNQAIADDTEAEKIIGIIDKNRGSVVNKNVLITSGVIDTTGSGGQNDLSTDAELYARNTYLYLSDSTPGKIVRQFGKWIANTNYSVNDFILEGDRVWKCIADAGSSDPSTEPTWSTPTVYFVTGDTPDSSNSIVDADITWGYHADAEDAYQGDHTIRIGTSLGSGVFLLQSVVTNVDDHNDSALAHPTIITAINKAGIYQLDPSQGVTDFVYRGQYFDENATFDTGAPVSSGEFVYKKLDGDYYQAIIDHDDRDASKVVGISYDVAAGEGFVIGSGFMIYNTTTIEGTTAVVGDKVYLSYTNAGKITTTERKTNNIEVGTVFTLGSSGLILINIKGDRYIDQATDDNASFEASVVQYDIVYGTDAGSDVLEYARALVDGTTKQNFLGVCLEVPSAGDKGIVQSQGYINMGSDTGTGSGTTGTLGYLVTNTTLAVGEKVYLTLETGSPGKLSNLDSGIAVGKYIGIVDSNYYLLMSGAGSGGSGDTSLEDLLYSNLLSTSTFTKAYYDTFSAAGTVTTDATYANSIYEGTIGQYLQQAILVAPTDTWAAQAWSLGDEILENGFVWECVDEGTSSGTEPDWVNKVDNTNLEAHYTMDDISGATLVDETTNYDGTITNAIQEANGKIGKSLNFLASDAYVDFGTSMGTALGGTVTDLSVSLWFQANDTSGDDGLFYMGAFGGADGAFQLTLESDNLTYQMSGGFSQTSAFTDTSTKFHLLVATFDGTNAVLWLDGIAVIDTTTSVPANLNLSGLKTIIGAFYDTTGYSLNGNIDQVRIYNEALDGVAVRNLLREKNNTVTEGTTIEDAGNVVWEVIRSNTDYRFSVHKEELEDALIYAQYSTDVSPSTWVPVSKFDEIIEVSGGFTDLHIKFIWGATGNFSSFGLLYSYDNLVIASNVRLFEVYTQSGAGSINDIITVPNGGRYTVDSESLQVFTAAGLKLHVDDHYEEEDIYSIKMLYALSDADRLIFIEQRGLVDTSLDNQERLDIIEDLVELTNQITYNDTATISDSYNFILCGTKSSDYTVTLFTAVGYKGRVLHIKNIGTDIVTVAGDGSENIDGSNTFDLSSQYDIITVCSNGTQWYLL